MRGERVKIVSLTSSPILCACLCHYCNLCSTVDCVETMDGCVRGGGR